MPFIAYRPEEHCWAPAEFVKAYVEYERYMGYLVVICSICGDLMAAQTRIIFLNILHIWQHRVKCLSRPNCHDFVATKQLKPPVSHAGASLRLAPCYHEKSVSCSRPVNPTRSGDTPREFYPRGPLRGQLRHHSENGSVAD